MSDPHAGASPPWLKSRLSLMMFLQYAIWGAWLPLLFPFLLGHRGFSLEEVGWIFSAGALGAIVGPFIAGQVADRYFSTEKFLAISHLIGAVLVWRLAETADYTTFLGLSAAYGVVYAPTLALTNSLAFHHLPDRDREFGHVRLFGTLGWIVVGIAVGQWLLRRHTPEGSEAVIQAAQDAGRADAFLLSGILGVVMGLFCFTLPNTPPSKDERKSATAAVFREVRRQPLLTLFLLAVPISIIHQFYFVYTGDFLSKYGRDAAAKINALFGVGGGGLMTIGQMSEILVLGLLPLVTKRLSRKTLLGIGILAYAARMAIFAYTDSLGSVLFGVALHGLCFGCFIFVAFMIVDEETSDGVRASAQNLFNLVIVGIGIAVGSWVSTQIGAWATVDKVIDYRVLFSYPMWGAVACLVLLVLFYPSKSLPRSSA